MAHPFIKNRSHKASQQMPETRSYSICIQSRHRLTGLPYSSTALLGSCRIRHSLGGDLPVNQESADQSQSSSCRGYFKQPIFRVGHGCTAQNIVPNLITTVSRHVFILQPRTLSETRQRGHPRWISILIRPLEWAAKTRSHQRFCSRQRVPLRGVLGVSWPTRWEKSMLTCSCGTLTSPGCIYTDRIRGSGPDVNILFVRPTHHLLLNLGLLQIYQL